MARFISSVPLVAVVVASVGCYTIQPQTIAHLRELRPAEFPNAAVEARRGGTTAYLWAHELKLPEHATMLVRVVPRSQKNALGWIVGGPVLAGAGAGAALGLGLAARSLLGPCDGGLSDLGYCIGRATGGEIALVFAVFGGAIAIAGAVTFLIALDSYQRWRPVAPNHHGRIYVGPDGAVHF